MSVTGPRIGLAVGLALVEAGVTLVFGTDVALAPGAPAAGAVVLAVAGGGEHATIAAAMIAATADRIGPRLTRKERERGGAAKRAELSAKKKIASEARLRRTEASSTSGVEAAKRKPRSGPS